MKKEKVVFRVGCFVDFAGNTREVVFAAVTETDDSDYLYMFKHVHLGVSAQNPRDSVANTELGKIIAEGKARKEKSRVGTISTENFGMINRMVVDALLTQELDYFKQNPGKYLKGYNKDRDLFKASPEAYFAKFKAV